MNFDRSMAEWLLFAYGKLLLGKDTGGLIARLYRRGWNEAVRALKDASEKQDPLEYVGAIVRPKGEAADLSGLEKPTKYKCPKCWQWYPDKCECGRAA